MGFDTDLGSGGPQHSTATDDHASLAAHVGLPVLDPKVVLPVDLEDDDLARGQVPLAVQVADPTGGVDADLPPIGWSQVKSAAHGEHIELAARLGAAGDVEQGRPHVRLVPDAADDPERVVEVGDGAQLLLHDHCQHCCCEARPGLPGRRVDGRAGDRRTRELGPVFVLVLAYAAGLVDFDAEKRRYPGAPRNEQVDLPGLLGERLQAGELQRRMAADGGGGASVEDSHPHELSAGGSEVVQDNHPTTPGGPAPRVELGAEEVRAHVELSQLVAPDHTLLPARQLRQAVVTIGAGKHPASVGAESLST